MGDGRRGRREDPGKGSRHLKQSAKVLEAECSRWAWRSTRGPMGPEQTGGEGREATGGQSK